MQVDVKGNYPGLALLLGLCLLLPACASHKGQVTRNYMYVPSRPPPPSPPAPQPAAVMPPAATPAVTAAPLPPTPLVPSSDPAATTGRATPPVPAKANP
ncbi:hypothetical protein [Niveispirillum fermenti]|uniref:hypothetical protein n=1 Tax=Niveispirillum fermenti TaxID=1233113 RepID=UPI003A887EE5